MSTVAAIGDTHELEGFALVGVDVQIADSVAASAAAWSSLGSDVGLVILSPRAARDLETELDNRPDVLTVVMP